MPIENPEQEPTLNPRRQSYPVEKLEADLGGPIDPPFEIHVIGRDESRHFGQLERDLSDSARALGLEMPAETEAYTDFTRNRLRQLAGSIWLRERSLLRRILGDEAAERGEIEEAALGGLTESEKVAYFGQTPSRSDDLGYSEAKVKLEAALTADQSGGRIFAVKPTTFQTFEHLFGEDDEPVGMEFGTIDLAASPITRTTETLHFSDTEAPGHDLEADAQRNELEAALPTEVKAVSIRNLTSFRSGLSEFNRRLDLLAGLDDLKLRAAVLNGTGLDSLLSSGNDAGMSPEFWSWE